MLALSVSISTSSSPRVTSSPSDFSHFRIVPSSMESDSRGIATSGMAGSLVLEVAEGGEHGRDHLRLVRVGDLLERLGVGHGQIGARDARDRRVEEVERLLL